MSRFLRVKTPSNQHNLPPLHTILQLHCTKLWPPILPFRFPHSSPPCRNCQGHRGERGKSWDFFLVLRKGESWFRLEETVAGKCCWAEGGEGELWCEAQGNQRGHQTCPVWLRLEQGRVLCSVDISHFMSWGVNSWFAWSAIVAGKKTNNPPCLKASKSATLHCTS